MADNIMNKYEKLKSKEEKYDYLEKFESKEFFVQFSNYKTNKNIQRATIKYNFTLPKIYSEFIINKAFKTGVINEDKLFITYNLVAVQIIRDIESGNIKKEYIVSITDTLFEKPQKLERLLNIINNSIIQDKINLKLKYEIFIKNKEIIYSLMQRGFRITVILDKTFTFSLEEQEMLNIFKYVLVNENFKYFEQLIADKDKFKNIIEI